MLRLLSKGPGLAECGTAAHALARYGVTGGVLLFLVFPLKMMKR